MTSHDSHASTHPPRASRPTIGIDGGIGSGKSAVARHLSTLGCVVSSADDHARRVLTEPSVINAIIECLGREVLAADGSIDRAALARAIFTDSSVRQQVEAIMHPRIHAQRLRDFASAPSHTLAFVIDAPLLLEVGLDRECDAVIFVDALHEARARRVAATRHWDVAQLTQREAAQLPLDEKRERSTHVVINSLDDPQEIQLKHDVARVFAQIIESANRRASNPAT